MNRFGMRFIRQGVGEFRSGSSENRTAFRARGWEPSQALFGEIQAVAHEPAFLITEKEIASAFLSRDPWNYLELIEGFLHQPALTRGALEALTRLGEEAARLTEQVVYRISFSCYAGIYFRLRDLGQRDLAARILSIYSQNPIFRLTPESFHPEIGEVLVQDALSRRLEGLSSIPPYRILVEIFADSRLGFGIRRWSYGYLYFALEKDPRREGDYQRVHGVMDAVSQNPNDSLQRQASQWLGKFSTPEIKSQD